LRKANHRTEKYGEGNKYPMSQNLEHEIAITNKRRIYCVLTKKNCCVDTAVLFSFSTYIYNYML
jgi:hypothetical protein